MRDEIAVYSVSSRGETALAVNRLLESGSVN